MLRTSTRAEAAAMVQPGWRALDVGFGDGRCPKAAVLFDPGSRIVPVCGRKCSESPAAELKEGGSDA